MSLPADFWPFRWSLRWVLVGCFVVVSITCLAVGAVFYFDIHAPPERTTVNLDQSPSAVIQANNELLLQVEHRTITTVSRVSDNGTTRLYRFEDVYDYSDHQYLARYDVSDSSVEYWHHHGIRASYVWQTESPHLWYVNEGWNHIVRYPRGATDLDDVDFEWDRDESADNHRIDYRLNGSRVGLARLWGPETFDRIAYRAMFINHTAEWDQTAETASSITFRIDTASTYAKVRPTAGKLPLPGSNISVTVSKQTGRIRSMTEHRIVNKSVGYGDDERTESVHLLVQTRIRDYRAVDVTRPDGLAPPPLEHHWDDLLDY